ncbi:unnamed protein product [Ectocarpus sp. CCAP 1310/34]|nr:unnamed protein product [Ectocarpus sp. CCAP 1310/34]
MPTDKFCGAHPKNACPTPLRSSRLGEVRSSGGVFDPYVYRGAGGKGLPPMMSSEGVKERLGIMRGHLKSGVCAGIIQVHAGFA